MAFCHVDTCATLNKGWMAKTDKDCSRKTWGVEETKPQMLCCQQTIDTAMDVQNTQRKIYLWWVSPRVSTALLARSWRTSGGADAAHSTASQVRWTRLLEHAQITEQQINKTAIQDNVYTYVHAQHAVGRARHVEVRRSAASRASKCSVNIPPAQTGPTVCAHH